jgi:glucose-6-phosphate 1-epimerase
MGSCQSSQPNAEVASYCIKAITDRELPAIRIESPDESNSVVVHLFGGTIISWSDAGAEKLYLNSIAVFNGKKAIRGGIPVVFPQFGMGDGVTPTSLPQHGFARTSMWTYEAEQSSVGPSEAVVVLSLKSDASIYAVWPHNFELKYIITLHAGVLRTELKCLNTNPVGGAAWKAQALLHTYLRVPRIQDTSVGGLQNRPYVDKLNPCPADRPLPVENRKKCSIEGEVDRVMRVVASQKDKNEDEDAGAEAEAEGERDADNVSVSLSSEKAEKDDVDVLVIDKEKVIVQVEKSAYVSTTNGGDVSNRAVPVDVVFWNAWVKKSAALDDMDNDAYLSYVCIEPGCVSDGGQEVAAGESLHLVQTLYVDSSSIDKNPRLGQQRATLA